MPSFKICLLFVAGSLLVSEFKMKIFEEVPVESVDNQFMEYLLLFAGLCILIMALMFFMRLQKNSGHENYKKNDLRTQKTDSGELDFVRCPLCSTPLAKNEDMFSRIYRPMNTPDQRMTVHGCPHCYPVLSPGVKRICPVCGKSVPLEGELVARLFNRSEGKKHVMITGCSECCGMKKKNKDVQ